MKIPYCNCPEPLIEKPTRETVPASWRIHRKGRRLTIYRIPSPGGHCCEYSAKRGALADEAAKFAKEAISGLPRSAQSVAFNSAFSRRMEELARERGLIAA